MRGINDFQKRFNRTRSVVSIFIGLVFALIVCFWVGVAILGYMAVDSVGAQDWSGGIKPVIERLWCGNPGCLN